MNRFAFWCRFAATVVGIDLFTAGLLWLVH